MSSRKDKFLESARKSIVKGQLDRAIKDYEQVVAIDPLDMKHRQKLAELLVRVNRHTAAIKEYEAIGKYYAENSYYLKAIAVYKQLQKLNPTDLSISLKLAEFNKKQGLTGNALAEYSIVYNYYQKTGDIKESFKLLEKMLEVDPDNLNTMLKYAEARYAAGQWDDAYQEFSRLALQLLKKGDRLSFSSICDRIQTLFPDRNDFILQMLEAQIENGEAAQAIPRLQEIIKRDNYSLAGWQLLANAYRKTHDDKGLNSAFRYMLHFFPNELYPREAMVQCAVDEGNVTKAVDLLNVHLDYFIAKEEFAVPEQLCLAMLDLAPEEPGVFRILKELYEASGEGGKLAGVLSRLAPPVSVAHQPEPEPEPLQQAGGPSIAVAAPEEPLPESETPWEDELDLSMVDELLEDVVAARPAAVYEIADIVTDEEEVEEAALSAAAIAGVTEVADTGFVTTAEVSGAGMDPCAVAMPEEFCREVSDMAEVSLADVAADPSSLPDTEVQGESEPEIDFEKEGLGWLSDVSEPMPFGVGAGEPLFTEEDLPSFSEFSSAIDNLFPDEVKPPPEVKKSRYNPDQLLSAFKKGVDEQLEETDSETHYNLGIAYREMGLFEDAIHELQIAGGDPRRAVDCMTLQGICYRDKGEVTLSEEAFKAALAMKDATIEELASATYELAVLYESNRRIGEAESLYHDVDELVAGFRDASARVRMLRGEGDGEVVELSEVD